MGIRAAWSALFGGGEKSRAADSQLQTALAQLVMRGELPRRGTVEILAAFTQMPWLRSVVGRIAEEVSTAAVWELYDQPEGHPHRQQISEHPLLDLLRDPMPTIPPTATRPELPGIPAHVVWNAACQPIELIGDGFQFIDRNLAGYPARICPIPPHWIRWTPFDGSPFFEMQHNAFSRRMPNRDVLWFRTPDPLNPYGRGAGIASSLADELDTDEYAAKAVKAFFYNGTVPDFLISAMGADEATLDRMRAKWKDAYSGPKRSHSAHFSGKDIKVTRLDTTFKDMDLVALRRWQRDVVCQTFGVPPEVFGILESSNRATIDAAYYLFSKSVLLPRLLLLRDELQQKLVPQFGERVYLGVKSPVPDDRDLTLRAIATAPRAFTVGDVRKVVGLLPCARDSEILGTAPINAGPTNLPAGKSAPAAALAALLEDFDARLRCVSDADPLARLEAAKRLEQK